MNIRGVIMVALTAGTLSGCGQYGSSGPDDVGLAAMVQQQPMMISMPATGVRSDKLERNKILSQWVLKSDFLCSDYQLKLSRGIRDARLGTDAVATILSGLATIFVQPAVTRPLSGAATIALGVGSDIQSDLFLQQAGEVVATAIQTVRAKARAELEKKWAAPYEEYTLEQGLVDVERYDRETCNLNVALNEIRTSLNIAGPLLPQANNPIIPLMPPQGGVMPPTATLPVPPPATLTIPPSVQKTPGGQIVFTPGGVASVPSVQAPAPGPSGVSKRLPPPPLTTPVGPATSDQHDFAAAVRGLKFNGQVLTPESRKIVDDCAAPAGFPNNSRLIDIRQKAGPSLASITACIIKNKGN
ncbi:MAG TPA: hypothetical protein VMI30_05480 [Stellaceae bacterium]|nr:hypothetical protein [Stellaceae bacterium]